jgi:hypothetical protein
MKKLLTSIIAAGIFACHTFSLYAQVPLTKLWDKTYGGPGIDHLFAGVRTADGGFIFGGPTNSGAGGDKTDPFKGGNSDYWIVKMDQFGNKQWDKAYGSAQEDILYSICQTTDGGFLLGGLTQGIGISGDKTQPGNGDDDFWIVKIDANGNKLWDKTFGGSKTDRINSIKQTADGGFLLAGSSNSGISGDKTQPSRTVAGGSGDIWILKTDGLGNKLWDKTYGGSNNEGLFDMNLTSDGGVILAGVSNSGIGFEKSQACQGKEDYWIVKIDAAGNKQWDKTFGGSDEDYGFTIRQITDGGYILGGQSNSNIGGDKSQPTKGWRDIWLLKLDGGGTKVWDKVYGTNALDYFGDIIETSDGGFLFVGFTDSGINGDKTQISNGLLDYWVVKLNSAGVKLWDQDYGGSDSDYSPLLFVMPGGGFVIAGESASGISGDKSQACQGITDFWIIKAGNVTGIQEEQATFPVSVFPNPAEGKLMLQFNDLKTERVEVTILDLTGRTIFHKLISTSPGSSTEELVLPPVKGMYLLEVKTGDTITTKKILLE